MSELRQNSNIGIKNDQSIAVSICCQTYNHKDYIEEALESFLMQKTDFDFEILLRDDASTDGTAEICREYAHKYPDKIKLLAYTENQWQKGVRPFKDNIKRAKGAYIAICEGDDYWTDPLKLQKQADFLEENEEYNICFSNVKIFEQAINKLIKDNRTREVEATTDISDLAWGNYIHTPSVMLRNDFTIPEWFKESPIGDWPLYMLALKDGKIKKLNEPTAVYRVHGCSYWSGLPPEVRGRKTWIAVKLVYENLIFSEEIVKILRTRLGFTEPKSIRERIISKLKKILDK